MLLYFQAFSKGNGHNIKSRSHDKSLIGQTRTRLTCSERKLYVPYVGFVSTQYQESLS